MINVYADNAATTRVSDTAFEAMLPYFKELYGNPSSLYTLGQKSQEALVKARETVAACINCDIKEITFTSGGSEADNQAIIRAPYLGAKSGKKHTLSPPPLTITRYSTPLKSLKKRALKLPFCPFTPTAL